MGWAYPGKEGDLTFSWSQWNSMNSLEGIHDDLGAPPAPTPLVQDSARFSEILPKAQTEGRGARWL